MKIKLELVINESPDGRVFLNYWDWQHGDDVCCEIKEGKMLTYSDGIGEHEITLQDFIKVVQKVAN